MRNPFLDFTIFPNAIILFYLSKTIVFFQFTRTMLLVICPISLVLLSIRRSKDTYTLFFIIIKLSFILSPILPNYNSFAVQFTIHPVASIWPTINPCVSSLSMKIIVHKMTIITRTVAPFEHTCSVFESFFISTFKVATV